MFEYTDKDLGKIIVKPNKKARRFIARKNGQQIQLTVPHNFNLKNLHSVISDMKPRLLMLKPKVRKPMDEDTVLQTYSFSVKIVRSDFLDSMKMSLKENLLFIYIPSRIEILSEETQTTIREMIKQAMRFEAKRILPQKTAFFAQKFGLDFNQVKINKSVGRWGSCSRKKNINFSLYLMLLPEKYIDYIVLHELAHTKELNHSEKFWKLLSSFCGEDAKKISREVKKFSSESYELLKD